jgi:nitrite reductase/ring-hydroxylating ferredoxin subunit
MDRRSFMQHGCLACAGLIAAPALLSGCSGTRTAMSVVVGDDLVIPVSSFVDGNGERRKYVVATHDQLKQPIAVFQEGDGYRAVLMRCTHRGAELRVTGDRLECSAHGSQFDSAGAVLEGPASSPLRVFPVVERDGSILISLKA